MNIWRISNYADLSGSGGLKADGRWNRRGTPVVYCSDHPSSALLEVLVHVDIEDLPETCQLVEIRVPEDVAAFEPVLPEGWQNDIAVSQEIGTRLLSAGDHPLIRVPSVVMPRAANYLLNPRHPAAARFVIGAIVRYPFDSRLIR